MRTSRSNKTKRNGLIVVAAIFSAFLFTIPFYTEDIPLFIGDREEYVLIEDRMFSLNVSTLWTYGDGYGLVFEVVCPYSHTFQDDIFSVTPTEYFKDFSITVTAKSEISSNQRTIRFLIVKVNDAPQIVYNKEFLNVTINEEEHFTLDLSRYFFDEENDAMVFHTTIDSVNIIGNNLQGYFDENITINGHLYANDGEKNSSLLPILLDILPVNDKPVVTSQNDSLLFHVLEDQPFEIPISQFFDDVDSPQLTHHTDIAGLLIASGCISGLYPSNTTFSGTIWANDGFLNSSQLSIEIIVDFVNDAPCRVNNTSYVNFIVDEDANFTIDLAPYFYDEENQVLSYHSDMENLTLTGSLLSGEYLVDGIISGSCWVSDEEHNSFPIYIDITVNPVNDIPFNITDKLNVIVLEDYAWSVNISGTFFDEDQDMLVYFTNLSNASITGCMLSGIYSSSGTYLGEVWVYDGVAFSDHVQITIQVVEQNDVPTCTFSGTYNLSVVEDETAFFDLSGLFHDEDGDGLTFYSSIPNSWVVGSSLYILFPIDGNYSGTIWASDQISNSSILETIVTVAFIDDAPVISNQTLFYYVQEDVGWAFNVSGFFSDEENAMLTFFSNGIPVTPDGIIQGLEPVNVTLVGNVWVCDGANLSENITVVIDVAFVNDDPVLNVTFPVSGLLESDDFFFLANFTDEENEWWNLSLTWSYCFVDNINGTPVHDYIILFNEVNGSSQNFTVPGFPAGFIRLKANLTDLWNSSIVAYADIEVIGDMDGDGIADSVDNDKDGDGLSNGFEDGCTALYCYQMEVTRLYVIDDGDDPGAGEDHFTFQASDSQNPSLYMSWDWGKYTTEYSVNSGNTYYNIIKETFLLNTSLINLYWSIIDWDNGGLFGNDPMDYGTLNPIIFSAFSGSQSFSSSGSDGQIDITIRTKWYDATLSLNASNPDTDGDGLQDQTEIFSTRSSPVDVDTDHDGLNDMYESSYKFIYFGFHIGDFYCQYDFDYLPFDDSDVYIQVQMQSDIYRTWRSHIKELDTGTHYDFNRDYQFYHTAPLSQSVNFQFRAFDNDWWVFTDEIFVITPDGHNYYDLYFGTTASAYSSATITTDGRDGDLTFTYTCQVAPLSPFEVDIDGDGLLDLFETLTGSNPLSPDTDGDGLNDNLEFQLKTKPNDPDSDYDGLTDYQEYHIYGTNPNAADTDGDRYCDKDEIDAGTSPTNPSSFPSVVGGRTLTSGQASVYNTLLSHLSLAFNIDTKNAKTQLILSWAGDALQISVEIEITIPNVIYGMDLFFKGTLTFLILPSGDIEYKSFELSSGVKKEFKAEIGYKGLNFKFKVEFQAGVTWSPGTPLFFDVFFTGAGKMTIVTTELSATIGIHLYIDLNSGTIDLQHTNNYSIQINYNIL